MLSKFTLLSHVRGVVSRNIDAPESCLSLLFVRWRKLRTKPRAASKMYYVRQPTPKDPEETEELQLRYAHYRTIIRAIRTDLNNERLSISRGKVKEGAEEQEALDHHLNMMELNRQWNEETAKLRLAGQKEAEEKLDEERLEIVIQREEALRKRTDRADQIIRMEKEQAKEFISMDNLEEEIERVLNTRTSYDFAIDSDGNIIKDTDEIQSSDNRSEKVHSSS